MAKRALLDMVKDRLPFLPTDNTMDDTINGFITDQEYSIQTWTKLSDDDVETEAKYKQLQKMLIAELVCYGLLDRQVIKVVGGVNGSIATPGKRIKSGTADVVNAEFDYGKAQDGAFLGQTADTIKKDHGLKACEYAIALGYNLPILYIYNLQIPLDAPAFMVFDTNNR